MTVPLAHCCLPEDLVMNVHEKTLDVKLIHVSGRFSCAFMLVDTFMTLL